jgi:hypothetical protein
MKTINLTLIIFIFIASFINAQTVVENRWILPSIGDNSDWFNDIETDDSGYVYYCATLEGSSYIIVGRLTPDLKVDWIRQSDFGDNIGTAVGLVIDDSSLYVARNSGTFSNRNAVITQHNKQTGLGNFKVYNNTRNTGDYITDIKLDKFSNVIITGTSYYKADSSESFIIKCDKNLNFLWSYSYLAPVVVDREYNHLAIDDSGNVFVTGKATIKLSPNGEVQWTELGADFIVVTQASQAITAIRQNSQWIIEKYDVNGNDIWAIAYDDGVSMGAITKMVIDDLENIYLCGSKGWPNQSWHTVKISAGGVVQWQVDEIGFVGNAYAYDLAVDKNRNVYVTGALYAWSEDLLSAKTVKYDQLGNKIWQQFYGSNDNRDRYGGCISVNDSLTVVVGGLISDTENRYSGDLIVWQYQQRERFKAIPDGWQHVNNAGTMWPQYWWSRFDYSKFPYPSSWIGYPILAASFDWPDWPVFVRAFGENQCYLNSVPGSLVYNPVAVKYWRSIVGPWEGSCYGFSLSSLLFFNDKLKINDHFPDYERTYDILLMDETFNMIHSYQLYTEGALVDDKWERQYSKTVSETFPELEEMLLNKRKNNRVLNIFNNNGSGGHAVVPCSLSTVVPGQVNLYIYDCNYPGSEQIIDINTTEGIWYYNKFPSWGDTAGIALDPELEIASQQPILPLNNSSFEGVLVFSTPKATTMIENPQGKRLGYKSDDGQIVDSIDNAEPIIPLTGTESPPIGYRLPDDAYKIKTQDLQDSIYTLTLFSDSTLFSVSRANCLDGETDLFSMDKGLGGIRYQNLDNVNKVVEIEGTTNFPGQAMTCSIGQITIITNDSMDVNMVGNEGFNICNYGPNKIYNLKLEYAFEPGYRIFEHSAILLDSASSHLIIPDWEFMDEKPLPIFVDLNGDGSFDDTLEVNNEYVSGINDEYEGLVPNEFVLDQNYPNPFNSMTTIRFGIPEQSHIQISVYNLLGQEVDVIADEVFEAGYSRVLWNAGNLSSGIYLCRIQASGTSNTGNKYDKTIKMLLVK